MNYAPVVTVQSGSLQRFLSLVFLVMGLGLTVTGITSWAISHDPGLMTSLFHTYTTSDGKTDFGASGWWWFAAILQLGMVFVLSWFGLTGKLHFLSGTLFFTVYAVLTGIVLAPLIYAYTDASVAKTFFITAATFGTCAGWGYMTKKDLLPMGAFFMTGLIGLLIALVVNIFLASPAMDFAISCVGILLFAGLTAYDIQKLRAMHDEAGAGNYTAGLVIYGALTFYLDFINLFIYLLRFFGMLRK